MDGCTGLLNCVNSLGDGLGTLIVAILAGLGYLWRQRQIQKRVASAFLAVFTKDFQQIKGLEKSIPRLRANLTRADRIYPHIIEGRTLDRVLDPLMGELSYLPASVVKRVTGHQHDIDSLIAIYYDLGSEQFRDIQEAKRIEFQIDLLEHHAVAARQSALRAILALKLVAELNLLERMSLSKCLV